MSARAPRRVAAGSPVFLAPPTEQDADEFIALVRQSEVLYRGLASPPLTRERFDRYLDRCRGSSFVGFLIRRVSDGGMVGSASISEIVRGVLRSGYLGYHVFAPYAGRGYMTAGLALVLDHAFERLRLHRLEANIQPRNAASLALVVRLRFRREGFSPRYLKLGGRWRDHERWAILAEEWRDVRDAVRNAARSRALVRHAPDEYDASPDASRARSRAPRRGSRHSRGDRMTVTKARALRLASASERSLVESSFGRSLAGLSEARLKQKVARARTLRDKYRDLAKRQRLEMRGKSRPSGRRPAGGNENTRLKAEMFGEALERLQGALAKVRDEGESSRDGARAGSGKSRGRTSGAGRKSSGAAKTRKGRKLAEEAREPRSTGAAARKGARRSPWDSPRSRSKKGASSETSRGTRKAGKLQRAGTARKQIHAGARGRRRQAARDAR